MHLIVGIYCLLALKLRFFSESWYDKWIFYWDLGILSVTLQDCILFYLDLLQQSSSDKFSAGEGEHCFIIGKWWGSRDDGISLLFPSGLHCHWGLWMIVNKLTLAGPPLIPPQAKRRRPKLPHYDEGQVESGVGRVGYAFEVHRYHLRSAPHWAIGGSCKGEPTVFFCGVFLE